MKFAQIIEFKTSRIDEFNANLHAWRVKSDGRRIRHPGVVENHRDADDLYLLMVEFESHDMAR
jgi:hypothetical protein